MKRIVSILLALVLLSGCFFSLTSCESNKPEIPEGYQFLPDYPVSFAYPDNWSSGITDNVITLVNPTGKGNNITFAIEIKSTIYDNMTPDSFIELIKPTFDEMGMKISGVVIKERQTNGLDVTEVKYKATITGVSFEQTLFITTVGDYTYSITVTLVDDTMPNLVDTVFNSIYAKNTMEIIIDRIS